MAPTLDFCTAKPNITRLRPTTAPPTKASLDFRPYSPIYIFNTHLPLTHLSSLSDLITTANGSLTPNINAARTILTKVKKHRRIEFDLRTKNIWAFYVDEYYADVLVVEKIRLHDLAWLEQSSEKGEVMEIEDFLVYEGLRSGKGISDEKAWRERNKARRVDEVMEEQAG